MVLKFRLISNEQDDFIRDFEILDDQTFFQLHVAIQDNLHYDKSQIASFFICTEDWEKQLEIMLFELFEDEKKDYLVMDHALIGEHISRVHDKLLYVFDVFNERLFFIELAGTSSPHPGRKYPVCSFEQGSAPQQVMMDPIFSPGKDMADELSMGDNIFGEDIQRLDDLDEMGYQTLDDSYPDEE